MARPASRSELVEAATTQFERLSSVLASMTEQDKREPLAVSTDPSRTEAHWHRDKNVRDVLIHLHEWHRLLLSWVEANQSGVPQPFLPEPYTWRTYARMNERFTQAHQQTSTEEAERLLCSTHEQAMALIQSFTDDELFRKGALAWTGTTTLGSYCVSSTSSHYAWAVKKVRAHLRTLRAQDLAPVPRKTGSTS